MAARKTKKAGKKVKKAGRPKGKKGPVELIISKSRVKASVQECNISKEFYEALDAKVRELIAQAEERALGNKRKTLRPWDL